VKTFIGVIIGVVLFGVIEVRAQIFEPILSTPALRSAWAQGQIDWFMARAKAHGENLMVENYRKPIAWGVWRYREVDIEWFAYSEENALFRFNLSAGLEEAVREAIGHLPDQYWWRWGIEIAPSDKPGAWTVIRTSNGWVDKACKLTANRHVDCKYREALGEYLKALNSKLPIDAGFKVSEYLTAR
jgi:hypothetical protein